MFKLLVVVGFQVDSSLSFLDGFVSEALAAGAAPYKPPHQRQEELAQAKGRTHGNIQTVADLAAPPCFGLFLTVMSASALSLEPYGLSLPISMSSCSIADRQSPTLLSMSSGLSGNSTDLSHKGGYVDTECILDAVCLAALELQLQKYLFLFQLYGSEAGWCEKGVGEGGLPGAEGTCGGGCPG